MYCKFVLVFGVIFCLSCVSGVGVSSEEDKDFVFEKNVLKEIFFGIRNIAEGVDVEYSLEGDLASYGDIEELSDSRVRVTFLFEKDIDVFGEHKVYFVAREVPIETSGATIMAVTSARVPIKIFVSYPYDYLDVSLNVENLKLGNNYGLGVDVQNLGSVAANDVRGDVIVKSGNIVVEKIELGDIDLDVGQKFSWDFDLEIEKVGNYDISVNVYYLGDVVAVNDSFVVGEQSLVINDFKKKFNVGGVEEFYVEVENAWSENMGRVYFEADFFEENGMNVAHVSSNPVDLEGFEITKLSDFLDLSDIPSGEYFVNGSVFFEGGRESFSSDVAFSEGLVLNGLFFYGIFWFVALFAYFKFKMRVR